MNVTYLFLGVFIVLVILSVGAAMVEDWQSMMGRSPVRMYWLGWLTVSLRTASLVSFMTVVGSVIPLMLAEIHRSPGGSDRADKANACAQQSTQ